MRIAAHVLATYLALLVGSVLWLRMPFERAVPDLVALSAIYLGLTARRQVAPAVLGAVIVGYLADLVMATPHGLLALTAGIICIAGHLVQGRLLVRGWLYMAIVSLLTGVLSGVLVLSISGIAGLQTGQLPDELLALLGSAALTGLVGPAVFWLYRRLDSRFARTQRDRTAALEGLWGGS